MIQFCCYGESVFICDEDLNLNDTKSIAKKDLNTLSRVHKKIAMNNTINFNGKVLIK